MDLTVLKQKLAFSKEIRLICEPLFEHLDINYFGYGRAYADGSIFDMSTCGNWIEHFYKEKYVGIGFQGKSFESGYYTTFSGLEELMPMQQFQVAAQAFNMHHPLVIIEKHKDYYEYFLITTHKENEKIYQFYLNNKDVLDKTKMFFKDKAQKVIQIADNNRARIPKDYHETFSIFSASGSKMQQARERLLHEITEEECDVYT